MHRAKAILVSLLVVGLAIGALGALQPSAGGGAKSSGAVTAGQTVQASVPQDVAAHADVSASGCDNSPGPYITLNGEIGLSGLGVQLIFQNNEKGTHTHTEETTVSVVVVPAGETIQFAKQPVQGGVGGNPFIWIQFVDEDGSPLSDEIFLGRCVQGLFVADASFVIPALASATVEGGSCDNTGSTIKLSGELRLTGIDAKLIFRNNDNPVGGPHEHDEDTTVSIVLIPAGETIEFAKQPPLGGAGGNPWIYLVFLDANGNTVSEKFLLGRCVQDF